MSRPTRTRTRALWTGTLAMLILQMGACTETQPDPPAQQVPDDPNNAPNNTPEPEAEPEAQPAPVPTLTFLVDPRPHDPNTDFEPAEVANYSDPFVIVAEGLPPGATVRLEAESMDHGAWATFEIGDDGTLDLGRDAPVEGTWEGVDPDGVVWSATEVRPPGPLDLSVYVTLSTEGEVLAEEVLSRRFVNEGIVTEEVSQGTIVGTLALPEGEGPFPGVMIFGGSEGGTGYAQFAAYQMAQLGFAAFGVGYFGAPGLPDNLVQIPLEQLEENLAFFADDPRIDAQRLAVMGGSRGGELALLLGAYLPDVKAVVANVPSGLVWGGLTFFPTAAWTREGEDVPFMPSAREEPEVTLDEQGVPHISYRNTFIASMEEADPEALAAATIPVEQTGGPILMMAGEDDQLWPSCPLAEVAWERLEASGHTETHGDVFLCFEGAGHNIGRPGFSTLYNTEYYNPRDNGYTRMGGTPQAIAAAQRAADTELRRFLEEALDHTP